MWTNIPINFFHHILARNNLIKTTCSSAVWLVIMDLPDCTMSTWCGNMINLPDLTGVHLRWIFKFDC